MASKEASVFGELEDQCSCWVCFEIFIDPITLPCSHTICKECALKVHKKNPSCPFCRRAFELPLPQINQEIVNLIALFLSKKDSKVEEMKDVRIKQTSIFFELPPEIFLEILAFLPAKDVGKITRVCRDFKRVADDGWIWRSLCQSQFPFCSVDKYGKSWKWCYIGRSSIGKGWDEGKAGDFEVVTLRGHKNYINVFSLYRNNIVSGSADSTLKVWKVDSEDPLNTLVGHNGIINCVQFNEVRIVSGAADSTLKMWDTRTGLTIKTLNHNGAVNCIQFDDNKIISGSSDNAVKIWDVRDGSCTTTLHGHVNAVTSLQFDNSHNLVTLGQDGAKVWDLRSNNLVTNLQDPTGSIPRCFQLVGANQLVTGGHDGQVKLWNSQTGAITDFAGARHYGQINHIQCDGSTAISACLDGQLKVWDITNKKMLHTLSEHKSPVHAVQFNSNKVVSGSGDNSIKVWNKKNGKKIYSLQGGSLQKRANNPEHPTKPGCSHLEIDDSRIVASFNSLIRVYDFEVVKLPTKQ